MFPEFDFDRVRALGPCPSEKGLLRDCKFRVLSSMYDALPAPCNPTLHYMYIHYDGVGPLELHSRMDKDRKRCGELIGMDLDWLEFKYWPIISLLHVSSL